MISIGLDHISLHVKDLAKSKHFYSDILNLKEIHRPDFDFEGAWYEMINGTQIHLIEGRNFDVQSNNRGNHFALRIDSINNFEKSLNELDYPIAKGPKLRIDNNMHMFLKDPDGYFIEFVEEN